MAGKKLKIQIKMLIKAGAANPAPPVGSTLGPHGINLVQFCKDFNDKTSSMTGMVPVEVSVFEDRSYEFVLKTAAVAELIKQSLKLPKGAANQIKETVGTISMSAVEEIAKKKMVDLNSFDLQGAVNQVLGTCKSMGVKVQA
jgi:large subunit ribosomal protein L11